MSYVRRVIDDELDELLPDLPAIAIEGARGVGKTETALQRAQTVFRLDDEAQRAIFMAGPERVLSGEPPVLLDEWQQIPELWDRVRRAVDEGAAPASFLLTGSAMPSPRPTHSGAGRIIALRMRPMSLAERQLEKTTVSLKQLLDGRKQEMQGETSLLLEDYVREIVASGFPGLRRYTGRGLRAQLDSYLAHIVEVDFQALGQPVRQPQTLWRWMAAYAAATATTANFETIRDAATAGEADKPARSTTIPYRDALERLWILEALPGWAPTRNPIARLVQA